MSVREFRALRIYKGADGIESRVEACNPDVLPDGDVMVRVHYSTLNYKDALSATGAPGVTRDYPHTPGIDAAGTVVESSADGFGPGDRVIVGGADFGATRWGGLSELVRVPARLVTPLPQGLTLHEAMRAGTAGFTAALCVSKIQEARAGGDAGADNAAPEALVTGATGGVGSFAIALLAACGFRVTAVTGKADRADYLRSLGAEEVVDRGALLDESERPLLRSRWDAVVDAVGGELLTGAIRSTAPGGVVTACGNAGGAELRLSVYPFILRGVTLAGIDSPSVLGERRSRIWSELAGGWHPVVEKVETIECTLYETEQWVGRILEGRVSGRVVVRVAGEEGRGM